MDRKGFIRVLWNKLFKPLLLVGVLIFCIRFIIRIFTQNDIERISAILVLGFITLSVLSHLLGLLFKNVLAKIKSSLSEKTWQTLTIVEKIFGYLLVLALGLVIYNSWQDNRSAAFGFFGTFLIFQIINIVRREKLETRIKIGNE